MKNAIESFAEAARADGDKAIAKLFASRPFLKEMPEDRIVALQRTIHEIFDTCESADARDVMSQKTIVSICLRGDDSLRSEAEIKAKADAIKANFREIRAAAQGNRRILAAGKSMMSSLNGKSLSPGLVGKLVAFATGKNAKLNNIRSLKSSSGVVTITKASIQYVKNIQAAGDAAGIDFEAIDGELANPMREFAGSVMLQRLGTSKLRRVLDALTGRNAAHLNYIAGEVAMDGIGAIPTTDEDLQHAVMGNPKKGIPPELKLALRSSIDIRRGCLS